MKTVAARILSLVLAVCLILTGLCGCHGQKKQAAFQVPEEFDTGKDIELTFWAKNDTNKTQTAIYQKAIEDFHALYPNVNVTIRLYTDYGKIYNDVITNIPTNTTPNVCITYPDHIATYMTGSNTVVPLDQLFADEKFGLGGSELAYDSPTADQMVDKYMDECKIGDQHYAIPFMRSTEAVYINKNLVEKLGYQIPDVLTWDWMFEVAEAAVKKNSDGTYAVNGQNVMIPIIYKSTDNMMIQMLKQKGAGYSTDAGQIDLFNDETSAILKEVARHAQTGAFSTFKISSYPANFLNAGQCIFAIDSTAGSTWMGTDAPLVDIAQDQIMDFETVVKPVPQFDPDHPQMISQGPSICIFNKEDPQVVLASWLFAQFLLTNQVQTAYAETEGYIPVTKKAQESDEYQQYLAAAGSDNQEHYQTKIDATNMLLANIDNTFTTPVFNGSASLRDAAGSLIESVVKSVRRKQTIDDAYITQLYADTTTLYHLDTLSAASGAKKDLGPLPGTAKALLITLGIIWIGIIFVFIRQKQKAKAADKR